ncbi:Glutathione S-transferase, N-terminal [Dillenia turbinata]|uniref:glutathione transferase n=1 Tax=Dillenia turbinata TaxID=194707 RepID=A0AAN8W832_9MAGN
MVLKLYGLPTSPCTTRVLACLHEKGLDYEFVPINLLGGEQKKPAFLEKNVSLITLTFFVSNFDLIFSFILQPFGKVPVLEDGDLTLFGTAITGYIAEKFKDTGFDLIRYGDYKEAALVRVWLEVEAQQYNPAIQPIVYQCVVMPRLGKPSDQKIIDESVEKLGKVLDVYEGRLEKSKYLAGDHFTLADLHHLSYTFNVMKTPYASLFTSRPYVKASWEDISSRPAFVKVCENIK